jgi:flagellar hook-associated protein 2
MAISSLGVGSGLDLEGLITKLMKVETQPLTRLQTKQSAYNNQISALGQIKSALASLQTAASAMKDPGKLSALKAESSDATVASASAAAGAVGGSYNVNVTQIASSHKLVSGVTPSLSAGTLSIKVGANTEKTVAISAGMSLSDVASAINAQNSGATATVVNGSGGQQLVVTSNASGKDNTIKMSGVAGLEFDPVSGTGSLSQQTAAQDAKLSIDGIAVESASNTVRDAVTGITLNLAKTGSTRLTVSADDSSVREKAETFVKEYNNVISTLKTLSQYNPDGASGVLNGDSTVRSLMSQVRNAVSSVPAGVDPQSPLKYLFDLGISADLGGTLKLDTEKLAAALEQNPSAATQTLTAYASAFDALATRLNGDSGPIETRTQGIQQATRMLDTQMETLSLRLEKIESQYRSQFAALDTLLSKLQSTSDYLAQQISSLGNMSSS